jgi:predicted DNA-binding transcriptional regulator AlpA
MTTREAGLAKTAVTERRVHVHEDAPGASRELLTVHDVAALLQVPVSWVYEHTRRSAPDALPVMKVGKYVRFRPADVLNYIEARRRRAMPPR